MKDIEKIRKAEKFSHTKAYTENKLYEKGSWLSKSTKQLERVIELLNDYKSLNILDLGSGVGRNSIYIAKKLSNKNLNIDCVDILDIAIEKLNYYLEIYNIDSINGIVSSVEDYKIKPNKYDLILAIYILEHISSKKELLNKLDEIKNGIKNGGIIYIMVNTNIEEYSLLTKKSLEVQFELNLKTNDFIKLLQKKFLGLEIVRININNQKFTTPREKETVELHSSVVTFIARKKESY